ncbi:amino acid ABC transporter membrane protein 2, PAAT family [Georgenia satyanarayanai]|uniref:Amino acid ABC transporter membrane protein 2, PAAT family n=1 Tax=Georgenia satyanarayanai TaxID=860221 RepID=A0A2Y9A0P0_9MICO|nr:ectoine/hydroxyectoine ABC transporter permease subunit EhuD [Georgenia satyanarayanai]PYG02251.1 amino acid ABC transporter membrane protein 2 (PAAT family) [Georgenia satyanarayanai]SSA37098.1 amino acid ABC transporter membrane protein 2, PAAT family [Georgenia satyanarayanai]
MNDVWSWERAADALPQLLSAFFEVTLLATVLGSAIAAVLGLVVAVVRRSAPALIARPVHWVMEFIRMTPVVIQLLFVYYAFTDWEPLWIGIGVLGIHYSTYMAEVYRSGIDNVPKGQWEAATALSLPRQRTWTRVVIPQALRTTVPALGTWVISMFKDTPFLFVITVPELVSAAENYGSRTFTYVEAFTLAGLIFLAASYPTSILVRKLEARLARY